MSTTTRLILLLLLMVGAVMAGGGFLLLRQRVSVLETATRDEARAHAYTLKLVLEDDYQAGRLEEVQQLINRLSQYPKIYSVIVFDEEGRARFLSHPLAADEVRDPPEARTVIATGKPVELVRRIAGEEVFSIIGPLQLGPGRRAAFEIAQPRTLIEADLQRAQRAVILITLALFAAISLGVLTVARRSLAAPIRDLLVGAEALGEGDLEYRVIVPRGGNEFARLARAFNRMADRLNDQRSRTARETEEKLAMARELRQHERLASLGRLAAGVAHEMGAPLNVIKGRAEQLFAKLEGVQEAAHDKFQRNLTIIVEQSDAIARIVRQLLDLARPYRLQRAPVSLRQLIGRAAEMVESDALRARVAVEAVAGHEIYVEVDADLIHQALINVCLNGIQAMPSGGRLGLEAINPEMARAGRAFAAIAVTDSGPGIAPEMIAEIFDPFFTTKEVGQGTGLGLTVTRRIIEEHGGWITVDNVKDGGAVFTIYLPQAVEETGKLTAAAKTPRKRRI
jgi:two-component system NtrC family sensor kinase